MTKDGMVKKPSLTRLLIKLALLLVFLVSYMAFMYWTLYEAAVLAEGGLEIRLVIIIIVSVLVTVWTFAKGYYTTLRNK